jgi:hypothetical protein
MFLLKKKKKKAYLYTLISFFKSRNNCFSKHGLVCTIHGLAKLVYMQIRAKQSELIYRNVILLYETKVTDRSHSFRCKRLDEISALKGNKTCTYEIIIKKYNKAVVGLSVYEQIFRFPILREASQFFSAATNGNALSSTVRIFNGSVWFSFNTIKDPMLLCS